MVHGFNARILSGKSLPSRTSAPHPIPNRDAERETLLPRMDILRALDLRWFKGSMRELVGEISPHPDSESGRGEGEVVPAACKYVRSVKIASIGGWKIRGDSCN